MAITQPSARSAPAVYLSNWKDIVGIWKARRLTQTDPTDHGPGLNELHYLGGRRTIKKKNQIIDYNGTFRDESGKHTYTDAGNFDSDAWLSSDPATAGTLVTRYLSYTGAAVQPRCDITRSYTAVPQQPFLVIRYTLMNPTATDLTFSILDQIRCNNTAAHDPTARVHGSFDAAHNALVGDMTAIGQYVIILGAFAAMDGHQVGDDTDVDPTSATASGSVTFATDGTVAGNDDLLVSQLSLAFLRRVTVPAGGTADVAMYLVVQPDVPSAVAAAAIARAFRLHLVVAAPRRHEIVLPHQEQHR